MRRRPARAPHAFGPVGSGGFLAACAGLLIGAGAALTQCDGAAQETPGGPGTRIFVAASLAGALEQALANRERFENIRVNTAASSTLARQLDLGARADLFVSANREWMDFLEERDRLRAGSRRVLFGNRLLLVSAIARTEPRSTQNPDSAAEGAGPEKLRELDGQDLRRLLRGWIQGPERVCLADPDHVPAGIYARQALQRSGIWNEIRERLLPGADARRTLWYLVHGACAAGIIYRTDAPGAAGFRGTPLGGPPTIPPAHPSESLRVLGMLRENLHAPINYEIALVQGASSSARELYEFLFSREAWRIFQSFGFIARD